MNSAKNISIRITGAFVQMDASGEHHVYRVMVYPNDDRDSFEVRKRFSEFVTLHKLLVKRVTKKKLPEFPSKHNLSETMSRMLFLKPYSFVNAELVDERKKELEVYMLCILRNEMLAYLDEVQQFLGLISENDEDMLIAGPSRKGSRYSRSDSQSL